MRKKGAAAVPEFVRKIIMRLKSAGFSAFAVGGCVRDTLLGREPHDWDVTTSAGTEEVEALFEKTVPTGVRYGTVTVIMDGVAVEVTTFRLDGAYRDARKPESVRFVSDLKEDLSRRDFTVNAMAMDEAGAVTDLFGGREDLHNRVIRCVGDPERRFSEDALRMFRAVRFSAQLGFSLEPGTLSALRRLAPLCKKLSAQRVLSELQKTLGSPDPSRVREMAGYGLLKPYIAEKAAALPLERLKEAPEGLRLPALAVMTAASGYSAGAEELLRSLHTTAAQAVCAERAEAVYGALAPAPDGQGVRLALCENQPEAVAAACAALGAYPLAEREIAAKRYVRPRELRVSGRDAAALGLAGSEISRALLRLARAVTLGESENDRAALLKKLRAMKKELR